jgi:hypothetical protein
MAALAAKAGAVLSAKAALVRRVEDFNPARRA